MCSLALERLGDAPKHEDRRRELTDLPENLEAPRQTTGNCPVSGMPVELLLTIFQFSSNPIAISHVCHQWREIALSQPTLWRSLVLAAPAEQAILKVPEWYKRSRGRIEVLNIRKSLASIFPIPSSYHRRHWQCDGHPMYYKGLLDLLRDLDLTQLKECHMEDVDAEFFFSKLGDGTRYVHQHLETLSASSSSMGYTTGHSYQRPCAISRLLNIRGKPLFIAFRQFRQFLQANPGLEKLIIEFGLNYLHHIPAAPDPLTLAHLRHLELTGLVPFRIERGYFSLPSLRIPRMTSLQNAELTLAELVEDEGTSFAELIEFTARGCFLGSQILASVLLRAPKLEILNCIGHDFNVVAESLTKPGVALLRDSSSEDSKLVPTKLPILCPALSVLDLSQSADLTTDMVMQIVNERIALAGSRDDGRYQLPGEDGDRVVSCIRALKVDECPCIGADMLP
ncbi:hypothetical protein EDB86DRAFT_208787 [Lactarius hatsudake]|nr:hypothetical protein EDB86DRAFT_208787 [Lactarius hatsudake]